MNLKEAEAVMLGQMRLLPERKLRALHINTLRALWREVCGETCDQLQGYHSDGCHQLTREYWRRKRK